MVCVLPLQWMTKISEWEDPDQNKLWSALLRNTWLIIGCGSLISVQTKSTLNRNECWELWAYLKVLNPRGRVGFKTTLKLQCGELSQLCMQAALPSIWTHLGHLCAFEVTKLVNWKCCCHQLNCQSVTSALAVLGNLTRVQGRPSSMVPGLIHTDQQRITQLCVFFPPPLYFFQMDRRRTEKFMLCSQHRCTDHPWIWSLATFWSNRRKQELGLFITAGVLVPSTLELWCLMCWYHYKSYRQAGCF